jgi:glycosyltransferase involved in cell wall biosynthesis
MSVDPVNASFFTNKKLTALLPVHNRGLMTASFVLHLLEILPSDLTLNVVLVDDGCTDDTIQNVLDIYDRVVAIPLDGHAFWGGSINALMTYVNYQLSAGEGSDYYLLANDDIRFFPGRGLLDALGFCSDMSLICARQAVANSSESSLVVPLLDYGVCFNRSQGRFLPAQNYASTNVSSTWAMISTSSAWINATKVPCTIPHYLSDYWLTFDLVSKGFAIVHPENFLCIVSDATTRNPSIQDKLSHQARIKAVCIGCFNKLSPYYGLAWLTFYLRVPMSYGIFKRVVRTCLIMAFSSIYFLALKFYSVFASEKANS